MENIWSDSDITFSSDAIGNFFDMVIDSERLLNHDNTWIGAAVLGFRDVGIHLAVGSVQLNGCIAGIHRSTS